jgi:hypothetical protein
MTTNTAGAVVTGTGFGVAVKQEESAAQKVEKERFVFLVGGLAGVMMVIMAVL